MKHDMQHGWHNGKPTVTDNILAITTAVNGDKTRLGICPKSGPCSYPLRPFFVELPSGLRHWFESELTARESQYWPSA